MRNKGEVEFCWGDWNGKRVITRIVADNTIKKLERDGDFITEIQYENDGNDNAGKEIKRTTYKYKEEE